MTLYLLSVHMVEGEEMPANDEMQRRFKSVADFTQTENLTLLGVIASGVVMLVIAEKKRSPYFRLSRAHYSEDA